MNPLVHQIYKSGKKTCVLCSSSEVNDNKLGEMYQLEDITVHYFCLLFSSGMYSRGEYEEGMFGFLIEDLKKEIRRGSRLRCKFCKQTGATIGCIVKRCRWSFHFPCGQENGVLNQFSDACLSYCPNHKPDSNIPQVLYGNDCIFCCAPVTADTEVPAVGTPCCNKFIFHRPCLQKHALVAGSANFRCPNCRDRDEFVKSAERSGVFVPYADSDSENEDTDDEEEEENSHCEAKECICPKGRDYDDFDPLDKEDTNWTTIRCSTCGSHAVHFRCVKQSRKRDVGHEVNDSELEWSCSECILVLARMNNPFGEKMYDMLDDDPMERDATENYEACCSNEDKEVGAGEDLLTSVSTSSSAYFASISGKNQGIPLGCPEENVEILSCDNEKSIAADVGNDGGHHAKLPLAVGPENNVNGILDDPMGNENVEEIREPVVFEDEINLVATSSSGDFIQISENSLAEPDYTTHNEGNPEIISCDTEKSAAADIDNDGGHTKMAFILGAENNVNDTLDDPMGSSEEEMISVATSPSASFASAILEKIQAMPVAYPEGNLEIFPFDTKISIAYIDKYGGNHAKVPLIMSPEDNVFYALFPENDVNFEVTVDNSSSTSRDVCFSLQANFEGKPFRFQSINSEQCSKWTLTTFGLETDAGEKPEDSSRVESVSRIYFYKMQFSQTDKTDVDDKSSNSDSDSSNEEDEDNIFYSLPESMDVDTFDIGFGINDFEDICVCKKWAGNSKLSRFVEDETIFVEPFVIELRMSSRYGNH